MNDFFLNLPLLIFLILIINVLTGAIFITYHLSKFGLGYQPKAVMTVFLFGLIILVFLCFYFFFQIDWTELIYD